MAKELRARGAQVILTRDNDRYVDLKSRPETAESIHADAFISFHFDSSPYANEGTGVTTYYYHKGNNSKKLASAINSQFNNLPLRNNGVDFSDFLVLRDNTRPAILCEWATSTPIRTSSRLPVPLTAPRSLKTSSTG